MGEPNTSKELLDNQPTMHVFNNNVQMSNIWYDWKASSGGIYDSQTCMPAVHVCDIPCVGVNFFNENKVAIAISWS